jgi:Na+-translocating ferredoxin:NAD+ oxidoreductase RnfD subunit
LLWILKNVIIVLKQFGFLFLVGFQALIQGFNAFIVSYFFQSHSLHLPYQKVFLSLQKHDLRVSSLLRSVDLPNEVPSLFDDGRFGSKVFLALKFYGERVESLHASHFVIG